MTLIETINVISNLGFQTLLTAMFFFFLYKWVDTRFFAKNTAKSIRDYNQEMDEIENKDSKNRLKRLQAYLEERREYFKNNGIDRVSVWLNHNGMRNGKIHFIFYSLVAEIASPGLAHAIENPIGSQKLPYYVFADFEERLSSEGTFFIHDVSKLKGAAKSYTEDQGVKSLVCAPIVGLGGSVDGLILFSSAFNKLDEAPNLSESVNDMRILFTS